MRSDFERVLDIQEAIHRLETEVPKRPLHQLEPIVIAGILRYLQIIGEATAKLSEELKAIIPKSTGGLSPEVITFWFTNILK